MDIIPQAPEDRSVLGRNAKRTAPEELSLRKLDLFEVPSEMRVRTFMSVLVLADNSGVEGHAATSFGQYIEWIDIDFLDFRYIVHQL